MSHNIADLFKDRSKLQEQLKQLVAYVYAGIQKLTGGAGSDAAQAAPTAA